MIKIYPLYFSIVPSSIQGKHGDLPLHLTLYTFAFLVRRSLGVDGCLLPFYRAEAAPAVKVDHPLSFISYILRSRAQP